MPVVTQDTPLRAAAVESGGTVDGCATHPLIVEPSARGPWLPALLVYEPIATHELARHETPESDALSMEGLAAATIVQAGAAAAAAAAEADGAPTIVRNSVVNAMVVNTTTTRLGNAFHRRATTRMFDRGGLRLELFAPDHPWPGQLTFGTPTTPGTRRSTTPGPRLTSLKARSEANHWFQAVRGTAAL